VQAAAVLPSSNVVARATPGDKLRLTQACRSAGYVVAVTGDGVNDGPALAAADVGFAVPGATDVAQAAASIVIVSGGFPAFLLAIKEGRRLHANLTHALAFYLGCKLGLVLLFVVGTLWAGFPLAPVQVVLLELFMDLGASTSFVTEAAEAEVMHQPPRRPNARFLDSLMLARIVAGAASMAGMVLGGFALGLHWNDGSLPAGQTLAFLCWLLGHVLLAVNQRTAVEPLLVSKPLLGNPFFGAWLAAVGLVALLVAFVPGFRAALGLTSVSEREWGAVLALCTAGSCWIEAAKWGRRLGSRCRRSERRFTSADATGNPAGRY
jgi:Ca2+-transporting ATPase